MDKSTFIEDCWKQDSKEITFSTLQVSKPVPIKDPQYLKVFVKLIGFFILTPVIFGQA